MARSPNMIVSRIGLVLLILFLLIGICAGAEENIYKIMILGNVKVEEGVIREAIKSREGGSFSVEKVREDLHSIFNLGYFTDVQVDIKSTPQGKEVIFIVVEKPSIKEILIKGNQKVKLDDIKEKMTLTPRSILNLEKVKENLEWIRKIYFSKGYYGVKVEYKVDYLETNEAVVTFLITEGPKGHIQKIVFKGNKKITSSELEKVMTTKKSNIFSIITKTGTLDEDVLKNDIQLLTAFYYDHGCLEVKISEPKLDLSNPKKIQIEIEIVEGPQYHLGDIDFKGDLLTSKEDLFKTLKSKRSDIYSNTAIRKDVNALTEKFANQGYAFVEITPETSVDPKNLLVHLTFDIDKKKRVSFEKIQIVGNTKTRDKVIRRELLMAEGELYNASEMNTSKDRLKRTGYFKEVDFSTSRGSTEEKIDVDVKVEEAPTGALTFGVGYSTLESIVGSASISDKNLLGYGYYGAFTFSIGPETRNFRLSLTDPYFLGYPFSAGIDLYDQNVEIFTEYSYKIMGGDLRFGKQFTDIFRVDAMYKLENVNVYNVSATASPSVKAQEGRKTTSAISFTPLIDTRDDYYNPTRGARHSLFIENAGGILGGDNSFVKVLGETSWFFPMPLKTVLNLRGKLGVIVPYSNVLIPIYEKFFVGGLYTVRGFEYGMAGPLDINGEPIGANKMVVFNSELTFPLVGQMGLKGALFFDIGKGFNRIKDITPLKFGIGPGIRWLSPFGPIHVDLGFNLNPKPGEKGHVFDFTAGTVY
jgi:outer membrane protein insertion porin family